MESIVPTNVLCRLTFSLISCPLYSTLPLHSNPDDYDGPQKRSGPAGAELKCYNIEIHKIYTLQFTYWHIGCIILSHKNTVQNIMSTIELNC